MENIYNQSDSELESEVTKEQKRVIVEKTKSTRARGGKLVYIGSSQDFEKLTGRVRMTRRYRGRGSRDE